jgi:heme-degrading monooxygenase HmoA
MKTIQQGNDVFTLINVFTVTPDNQQKAIDMLVEAGEKAMMKLPGFISSNLHKSFDGKAVVNYVQWRSQADFESMQQNPLATPHMQATADLSESYHPITCEIVASVTM